MAMPIVEAFSEGLAAVGASGLVASVGAPSVLEGRVCRVDVGSSVVVGGGSGVGVVVEVVVVVSEGDVEVRDVVVDGVFVAGVRVGLVRVWDVLAPAPIMSLVRRFIPEFRGSMMSEYSDCMGAAMLVGSAEISISSAFVGPAASFAVVGLRSVAEAESEPDSVPTWRMAVRRPPMPPAVFVASVIFARPESLSRVLLRPVELLCTCAPIA